MNLYIDICAKEGLFYLLDKDNNDKQCGAFTTLEAAQRKMDILEDREEG